MSSKPKSKKSKPAAKPVAKPAAKPAAEPVLPLKGGLSKAELNTITAGTIVFAINLVDSFMKMLADKVR